MFDIPLHVVTILVNVSASEDLKDYTMIVYVHRGKVIDSAYKTKPD